MGCLGFFFFLFSVPNLILAAGGQALPGNWKKISVSKMKVKVIDGDTFDVDIDPNGFFLILKSGSDFFTLILPNCLNQIREKITGMVCLPKRF